MKIAMSLSAILMLAMVVALPAASRAQVARLDAPGTENIKMNNAFAIDLYQQLRTQKGNLFFSPSSIQTVLAMTLAGARGATAAEMAATLHLANDPKTHQELGKLLATINAGGKANSYELSTANALWGARGYPFMPEFVAVVDKTYGSHLSDLDFAADPAGARSTINAWVAEQTHDRIKDLLPPGTITPTTRLVLTNAIYFKGQWDLRFKKQQTQDADFHIAGGTAVKVPLMFQQNYFRYAKDGNVQVLELPYQHDDLAMRIYLPTHPDGLDELEKQLTDEHMTAVTAKLNREEVSVWLPRFKLESKFQLSSKLEAMGMKLAFDAGKADFSGITSAEGMSIGEVIHQAFVKTDEDGTEAAAATAVGLRGAAKVRPELFRADHPFVFTIVHQATGAVLFMGRVAQPE